MSLHHTLCLCVCRDYQVRKDERLRFAPVVFVKTLSPDFTVTLKPPSHAAPVRQRGSPICLV